MREVSFPKTAEVVVLGGGVMGASTAFHLAQAGVRDVLLLEREAFFGTGATGRCAGGIRHQFETEVNIRLSQASLPMLDALEESTGVNAQIRKCGYLFVLTREADLSRFQDSMRLQHALGVETQWLSAAEVRERAWPCEFPEALAGTFHPGDGLADPNSVVMGYIQAARRHGAQCWTGCAAQNLETTSGRISAVRTSLGRVETEVVVNACGPWSAEPGRWVGLDIPVVPLRRQWFTTDAVPDLPDAFPFVIDFAQSLYFHREGSGLLTGKSNPNEFPGADQSVDPNWELQHIEAALQRMPCLEHVGIRSRVAGLYEVTPDAHPIIGKTPVPGFLLLAGFSGHGFMQGPICGKLLSEILLHGQAHTVDVSALDWDRFAEERLIPEFQVV
jgi:sarcosine oxidase subunit beta